MFEDSQYKPVTPSPNSSATSFHASSLLPASLYAFLVLSYKIGRFFKPSINFSTSAGFVKFFLVGPFPSLLFRLPFPSLPFPLLPPVPSLPYPSPSPLPSLSLLPSLPLPSPPLEVGPLFAARNVGERLSSPTGSGRSPAAKRFLMHFSRKM